MELPEHRGGGHCQPLPLCSAPTPGHQKYGYPKMDGENHSENPIRMDDLGVSLFLETHQIHLYTFFKMKNTIKIRMLEIL